MATHPSSPAAHREAVENYREKHLNSDLCLDCSRRAVPGAKRCSYHKETQRQMAEARRIKARRKSGLRRYERKVNRFAPEKRTFKGRKKPVKAKKKTP